MRKPILLAVLFILNISVYSQDINGKLGTNGQFIVRDTNTTFLTLNQSSGYLNLSRSFVLPNTASSTAGVIYKDSAGVLMRFIHNYKPASANGLNTFVGINSGNFTMTGAGDNASENTGIGYRSLSSLTQGYNNTGIGSWALSSNTSGVYNTALG